MKHLLFATLLLASFLQSFSQIQISGWVKDTENSAVPFAFILIEGKNTGTMSDQEGKYILSDVPAGQHTLLAQALGFKSKNLEILAEGKNQLNIDFILDQDVLFLEQVVITGTRTAHYIKDVPVRTEIITSRQIQRKNAANLFQALDGVPGVRVENQCQSCNFSMIRMQGLGGEHSQVLINGMPMYSGLAGVYGLQQISTLDIDRIEVIKGAGSALYGSGAIAGAINIVTREPSFLPSTTAGIQLGRYNTNRFDLASSMRNERGNIGLNLHAQRYSEGSMDVTGPGMNRTEVLRKDGISDRVLTNLTNAGIELHINSPFLKDDKLVLRGKSIFEKREGGIMDDDYYRNPLTDGTENITTDRYEASVLYTKPLGKQSEINYSFSYIHHDRNATSDTYLNDYLATHSGQAPDLRNMRPYLALEKSFNSTLTFSSRIARHHLMLGIQGFMTGLHESGKYIVVDENSAFYGQDYKSTARKSARETGIFIQDEWAVSGKWMIVPGVRFDRHHSSEAYQADKQVFINDYFPESRFTKSAFNPRIAVKYSLSDRITLRANAGSGFRAPYGFSEDLHLCSGSPRVWKSSSLLPETSGSLNFAADYYHSRYRLGVNLFRTELKNKIDFTAADDQVAAYGYDYQWANVDDATVQGVEFSFQANLIKHLDLTLDLTFNQGKYRRIRDDWKETEYAEISRSIPRLPSSTANFMIMYTPSNWSFIFAANYQGTMFIDYHSDETDPQTGNLSMIKKTEDFMLLNLKISKAFSQFNVYGGIDNMLNYVQQERRLDDPAFIYGPLYGTMFYLGASVIIRH